MSDSSCSSESFGEVHTSKSHVSWFCRFIPYSGLSTGIQTQRDRIEHDKAQQETVQANKVTLMNETMEKLAKIRFTSF